jgi:DNA-binding winged helix-turn-helix (wHTH) protein
MLKSHKNLLEPRPSDRLRIGDRIVDIPLREIAPAAGGDATRVTLKSLGVLLTLVAHANKLVSREALLEWVWPDTLPGDDVVTQAITQLRRALGDDREQPRYIETIAKQGYRLVAPVEWLLEQVDQAAAVTAEDASAAARIETSTSSMSSATDMGVDGDCRAGGGRRHDGLLARTR